MERHVRSPRDPQPAGGTAVDIDQALEITAKIGYPALVRPSYVLGGRAMEIVYDDDHLRRAMAELAGFGSLGKEGGLSAERPVLVDRFLEDATEVDVDALRDHTGDSVIGAVMEHVEEAGVHSATPPVRSRRPAFRRRPSRSSRTTRCGSPRRSTSRA